MWQLVSTFHLAASHIEIVIFKRKYLSPTVSLFEHTKQKFFPCATLLVKASLNVCIFAAVYFHRRL